MKIGKTNRIGNHGTAVNKSDTTPRWSSMRFVLIVFSFFGSVRIMSELRLDRSFRSNILKAPNEIYKPNPMATTATSSVSATSLNFKIGTTSKPINHEQQGDSTSRFNNQKDDNTDDSSTASVIQNQEPFQTECVRFATMDHSGGNGLGHRFTVIVFGMKFAQETNSTYVYDDAVWYHRSKHGSYPWMTDFLPLRTTELTKGDSQYQNHRDELQTIKGQWSHVAERSKSAGCDASFHTDIKNCCEDPKSPINCYCTKDTARIGTFDAMKGRLRDAFSKSEYTPPIQLSDLLDDANSSQPIFSIAWHVRLGDIVLNARKEYFWAIATQIAAAFRNSNTIPHVFVFGEGGESVIAKEFPFLREMCHDFFHGRCSYPEIDVRDTLYHMIHSDVLVTSGSSFPAMAGVLRSRGVTLAATPKEGVVGIYELSEHLKIDHDGNIPKIMMLQEFLEERAITNHRQLLD